MAYRVFDCKGAEGVLNVFEVRDEAAFAYAEQRVGRAWSTDDAGVHDQDLGIEGTLGRSRGGRH